MTESAAAHAPEQELSDEELAGVVGGITPVSGIAAGSQGWWQPYYRSSAASQPQHAPRSAPREEAPRQESPVAFGRRVIDVRV
ncbi:MAG TPA: hypothetical protein PKM88_00370 [bacterium]|nr:hypothetical protein [bacterium]